MIIIINDGYGQMCNKLYNQMNVLASALEWKTKVIYYDFMFFNAFDYSNLIAHNILKVKKIHIVNKVIFKIQKLLKYNVIKLENQYVVDNVKKTIEKNVANKKYYFYGWPFSNLCALRKHKYEILKLYKLNDEISIYIKNQKSLFSQDDKVLFIGVHIRRGDYRDWRNGKYYFEDNVYKKFMDQLYERLIPNKCVFFLFSNELLNYDFYLCDSYNIVWSRGNAEQDFHLLSSMDYIISPPSTFSGLASFMGDTPRYIIKKPEDILDIKNMHIWLSETDNDGTPLNDEQ